MEKDLNKKIINFCRYLYKKINPEYGCRPMVKHVKNNGHNKDLVGVEIGVYEGANAYNILKMLDIKHLYLVDPFTLNPSGSSRVIDNGFNDALVKAIKRLKPYGDKVTIIKKTSNDAVDDIPNNLDFVYIDGGHTYNCVWDDINNYYPKVKPGGVIGGHDFLVALDMYKAPIKFADKHNLKLCGINNDWWIIKK